MADKVGALVVCDGGDQRATQGDHEVRHRQAQDQDVHGLQKRRVPQHHSYHQSVVKNRKLCVDERQEGKNTVAHRGENNKSVGHRGCGCEGDAVPVHAGRMFLWGSQVILQSQVLSFLATSACCFHLISQVVHLSDWESPPQRKQNNMGYWLLTQFAWIKRP